jgi:segregation and condensation protein B
MTDEIKEISNEERRVPIEQPAVAEEETDLAEGVEEPAQPENEPAGMDEPVQQSEMALQGQDPRPGNPEQAGDVLVEMLETTQPEDTGQEPPESELPPETAEASGSPSSDLGPPSSDESPTVESVVEAILFASDEPLAESRLAGIVETTPKQIRESVEALNARYGANGNAFRIEQIAGGYQMLTQPIYNPWLKKMVRVRSDNKLSPAAMETLAIIAYKQPIIRADIEAIRGVAVGEVIRSLMYKGLVKITGRAEILGRPMLYGTTKKFLEVFGLNSIKDLPKAEDLKNPDQG